MAHPITTTRIYLLSYTLIWLILTIIQVSVLIFFYDLQPAIALADSAVVNVLHGIIGLAVWYPVRFNPLSQGNFLGPLINIFATGVMTVGAWTGLSYFILRSVFHENMDYLSFLENSVPNRIITDTLFFALLVMVYSLIVYSLNLREKVNNESNLKSLVREAELNMLKTQINPHFLFNSLNSISHLIKKDPERAREMIIQLSGFLRFSLRYGEDETITLEEELENMARYLEIEKIRFGEKLNYSTSIDKSGLKCMIPNMILQPLLENAIKHGVYESTEPIKISLRVRLEGRFLEIVLSNEFDPEGISRKGAGIGLKNISERLRILFGRSDLLNIEARDGLFTVSLKIPQKTTESYV